MTINQKKSPPCFGDLEIVFPVGEAGLRQTPESCMICVYKTDCLRKAMAEKGGVKPGDMLQVLNNGTGRTFASMSVFPDFILSGSHHFGATVDVLMKDVDLAVDQGEALGIPMWVCRTARQVLKHGVFKGYGQKDLSRIYQMLQDEISKDD